MGKLIKTYLPDAPSLKAGQIVDDSLDTTKPKHGLLCLTFYEAIVGALHYEPFSFAGVDVMNLAFVAVEEVLKDKGFGGALTNEFLALQMVKRAPFVTAEVHPRNESSLKSLKRQARAAKRERKHIGSFR